MDEATLESLFALLGQRFVVTEGLSDAEVEAIETRYGFRFPPDLRAFLQYKLPASGGFVNWRSDSTDVNEVEHRLSDPLESVLMNIGSGFWYEGWGARPPEVIAAYELAFSKIPSVPLLIPVFGQKYLPAAPLVEGNPVFSLDGPNVSVYEYDLASFLEHEFLSIGERSSVVSTPRHIEFWSDLASC